MPIDATSFGSVLIPAGYLWKRVVDKPDWLSAASVRDVYSLSTCCSKAFADDYFEAWKHNDFWLFDSPEIMAEVARDSGATIADCRLFYFEIFDFQFDDLSHAWSPLQPVLTVSLAVRLPETKRLEGYDVVCFSSGHQPECSPLSCNSLAAKLAVNEHCLFATFAEATTALEQGRFKKSEPGPFRIVAVYSMP